MCTRIARLLLLLGGITVMMLGDVGCNGTLNATVNITATITVTSTQDVDHVVPGQTLAVNVAVMGVVLVDPNTTPTPAEASEAAYLEFFLDSTSSTSILVTAQTMVSVPIPMATPPGHHHLLCRVDKHDGTPTTTTFDFSFTVVASVTTGTDAGVGGG